LGPLKYDFFYDFNTLFRKPVPNQVCQTLHYKDKTLTEEQHFNICN